MSHTQLFKLQRLQKKERFSASLAPSRSRLVYGIRISAYTRMYLYLKIMLAASRSNIKS